MTANRQIDWEKFISELGDIPHFRQETIRRVKSRDFYWYSPILKRRLDHCIADLIVQPSDREQLKQVIKLAVTYQIPITLRGRGSGNYGQAVPLEGGLVIDMTSINRILEITEHYVRAEAGCNLYVLNQALQAEGKELAIFSSTQRIATVGGFVSGGSTGIGSVEHGMLRDPGIIGCLLALSVEKEPKVHEFIAEDINLLHHAWGINGVITEVTLKIVPRRDWIHCMASFPSYRLAFEAGLALGHRDDLHRKLVCTAAAGFVPYFAKLETWIKPGRDIMLSLVDHQHINAFEALVEDYDGSLDLCQDEQQMAEKKLPDVFEFAFNHTTLRVLKVDPSVTYLQCRLPTPIDPNLVDALKHELGCEAMMHHEFVRIGGELTALDLPVVFYKNDKRLYEIIDIYRKHGCGVSDPHTYFLDDSSLKSANFDHLILKKHMDPHGLLNPGKSKAWEKIKHMTPDEIKSMKEEMVG